MKMPAAAVNSEKVSGVSIISDVPIKPVFKEMLNNTEHKMDVGTVKVRLVSK